MERVAKLPKTSSHLLTSTQVITSVFSVVKELVENALDSSCTNIEIKLENSGMDKIEVRDNGCGINVNDIAVVVKPHYTSKIQSHLDLEKVQSYGFRGEALSAICAISNLSIATKRSSEDIGVMCNMNNIGEILFSKAFSCKQGTVVTASNLFCNMPVRKQFYKSEKHKKEELKKIEDILIAFACAEPSVRFALYHNKNLIWQKSSVNSVKEVLFQVFGDDILSCMEYAESFNEEIKVKMEVYFPKQELKRVPTAHATTGRCIVLVNKRPVRIKAIDKLLCEVYAKFNECDKRAKYPVCFVGIGAPSSMVDVNFEPNKTIVLLQCLDEVMNMLTTILNTFYNNAAVSDKIIQMTQDSPCIRTENQNNLPLVNESCCKRPSDVQCNEFIRQSDFSTSKKNENSDPNRVLNISRSSAMEKTRTTTITVNNSYPSASSNVLNHIKTIKSFFKDTARGSEENGKLTAHSFNVSIGHFLSDSESKDDENVRLKRKRRFSDSSLLSSQSSLSKRRAPVNADSMINSWSRGVILSEKVSKPEPVCILVPRNAAKEKEFEADIGSSNQENENSISERPQINKGEMHLENNVPNKSLVRQMTSFDYFCRSNRLEVASCHPEYNNHQVAQILSNMWNDLSEEEKLKYKNLSLNNPLVKKKCEAKAPTSPATAATVNKQKLKLRFTPKKSETKIDIRFELLKKGLKSRASYKNLLEQQFRLISSLAPGVWIYSENHQLHLLNCFRLQEAIIYCRLLETYELKPELLVNPIEMSFSSLENSDVLHNLNEVKSGKNGYSISDKKLTANGFSVSLLKGETENIVKISAITNKIPFYGCTDLGEILSILKSRGMETTLSECRPTKVINYIQGEAVRIARRCCTPSRTDVEDILAQRQFLPPTCETCTHQKPFFYEFFTLNK